MSRKKEKSILACLKELGVERPYIAEKLKDLFSSEDDKTRLSACRLYLALSGDIRDERSGAATLISNGPTMVILGMTRDKIRALREGPVYEQPALVEIHTD